MRKQQVFAAVLLIAVLSVSALSAEVPEYVYKETNRLVAFVQDAAELIEEKGEKAFPELREEDGDWFHDDTYVFVWGIDGMRYVYPPDVSGEGENMMELEDIDGKPIGGMIVEQASSPSGSGWVHYKWAKPGEKEPVWKSTFIAKAESPSGTVYLVGSGDYEMRTEPEFVVQAVNDAINLLERIGISAIDSMRLRSSEFIFLDSYVFVKDMEGNEIMNPFNPQLEGTNIIDLEDINGKHFVREELEILDTEDDCWMDYEWPKPGENEPSHKRVYTKKVTVSDVELVVGAGYYPE